MSRRVLLVVVASLLASSSTTEAFNVQPTTGALHNTGASSQLGYATTADSMPSQFEPRVRNLVNPQPVQQQVPKKLPNNMIEVSSKAELMNILQTSNQLTVVRFHAPFCKACKAMAPYLQRFAQQHLQDIKFVEVAVDTRNPDIVAMMKEFGITKVPYGVIYHPEMGIVQQANFNKRYFRNVSQMIETYVTGLCQLPQDVNEYSQVYTSPYGALAI